MGTRGFVVIKYKNMYYRIYNHFDSYPQGLGVKLVAFIRTMNGMSSDDVVRHIMEIYDDDVLITEDPKDIENDLFIEWVYIIDLDNNTFKFTGGYCEPEYPLYHIPKDWFETFSKINEERAEKAIR